jgi:hypothetical protein
MLAAMWLRRKIVAGEPLPRVLVLLHALTAGGLLSAILLSPTMVLHLHPAPAAITMATMVGAVIFSAIFLAVRYRGSGILRFATLAPVFLGLAFLLRLAAPAFDQQFSTRSLAQEIAARTPAKAPVAAYDIPRELEYGLNFYFNEQIARYDNHDVPHGDHALISHGASEEVLESLAPGRRFIPLGGHLRQNLSLYWVTADTRLPDVGR